MNTYLLLSAVMTLASMQEQLSHDDLTIRKMKKMLGIVRSSEKLADPLSTDENADAQRDNADAHQESGSGSPSGADPAKNRSNRRKGERKKPQRTAPTVCHHPIKDLCKGDH